MGLPSRLTSLFFGPGFTRRWQSVSRSPVARAALLLLGSAGSPAWVAAQARDFTAVRAEVHFEEAVRPWDGFGFNYVETAQTTDYENFAQEYGGFSLLDDTKKREIIELVFGEDGLKVGLLKMFHDPWHQAAPDAPFDHRTTTENIRYFAREGLKRTRADGRDLQIVTTLYGPPGWATRQKAMRGRDFDPAMKEALATYMVDWVRFLREEEGLPVSYYSLHNEGEDWWRWPADGLETDLGIGHDYNMYWSPELVVEFVRFLRERLDDAGFGMVGVTNGEPTNWLRFATWGYAHAFDRDEAALRDLALITSHGFYAAGYEKKRWYAPHTSQGITLLREKRPALKAWVTSTSWSKMDAKFAKEMHGNIYDSQVNGIIPWAGIQRPAQWVGGDPNPGSAFTVKEDGTYVIRPGYYFYKQLTRAGQPGTAVARTMAMDTEVSLIGFASNGSGNPDAVVVINWSDEDKTVELRVSGSESERFRAFVTTEGERDEKGRLLGTGRNYASFGEHTLADGTITFEAPAGSVITFFGGGKS